jgi:hypothetical protein
MEFESSAVIDVQVEQIDLGGEKSIEQWYSARQMMSVLRLTKADLQKSISKLQDIYGLNLFFYVAVQPEQLNIRSLQLMPLNC